MSLLSASDPTASDLAAVRDALPLWLVAAGWIATPLLLALLAMPLPWLADRVSRPKLDGLHWTEAARLRHAADVGVLAMVGITIALAIVMVLAGANGEVVGPSGVTRAFWAGGVVWLATRRLALRRVRRLRPDLTTRAFVAAQALIVLLYVPAPAIAGLMAWFGPAKWTGHEWSFVGVYLGGVLAMLFTLLGGLMPVARRLGLVRPASARLRALVDDVSQRTGVAVLHVCEIGLPSVNAFAMPISRTIGVTDGALRELRDEELRPILLHELGHLQEGKRKQIARIGTASMLVVLGMWRPLVEYLDVVGLVGAIAASIVGNIAIMAHLRRLEHHADEHALQHESTAEAGDYARALERIYELNLMPAVLAKAQTHPHLYDRMVAAGVQPAYARPEPPAHHRARKLAFSVMSLLLFAGELFGLHELQRAAHDSALAAQCAVALDGGAPRSIGDLGLNWADDDPARAAPLLRYAAERTDWPGYPARLAMLLAEHDPVEARRQFARAQVLAAETGRAQDWDEYLASAREWVEWGENR